MLKLKSSTEKKKDRRLLAQGSYVLSNMDIPVTHTPRNPSTRNPIARLLKHFTPKRFKDKTKYNRKRDDSIWKRTIRKGFGIQD